MKEPSIRIGFIIFNEGYKYELQSLNGHRKTAFNWIKKNNLIEKFYEVLGTNGIYDEEDFLMEYIGAIKLYGYSEIFCINRTIFIENNLLHLKKLVKRVSYN